MSLTNQPSKIYNTLQEVQIAVDAYTESRKNKIDPFLKKHFDLKECFAIQKSHFKKDLVLNPINAILAIVFLSFRKAQEISEKLGWQGAVVFLQKFPLAVRTDFQKHMEVLVSEEIFGLAGTDSFVSELKHELEKQAAIKVHPDLITLAEAETRAEIRAHFVKQNGFTDLFASLGILIIGKINFGDKSLDIFDIGKNFASRWARTDAERHFVFGKNMGKAFYSVARAPAPTATQILISTSVVILALALFSTLVSVLSYPIQKKLGFRKRQLELLVEAVSDRLLLKLSKQIKAAANSPAK